MKKTKAMKNADSLKLKKQAVTIVAALFLFLLYIVIFGFSAQDSEESGNLSHMISVRCVELANSLAGKNWSQSLMEGMVSYVEHPIRKLAHFMEYACMGVLVYAMWRPWRERGRKLCLLAVLWVLVSAAGDELHQLFVPGRYGSLADVLLDTCGGAFGALLCILAEKLWRFLFGRKILRA